MGAIGFGIVARGACLALLGALSSPALSQDPEGGGVEREMILDSQHFLSAHPDIRWRREGVWALEQDQAGYAAEYFRRAARYADKPSQAMLAEMYWSGLGVEADRPLAYAWMDLAAERAYPVFLAKREHYWARLSEAERARVQEVGIPLYEQYGDEVAKPRLERLLARARRDITGSRVGNVGALKILVPGPGGAAHSISGDDFYDDEFWEPARYWAWQDRAWKEPASGRVHILPIEPVRDRPDDAPRELVPDDEAP